MKRRQKPQRDGSSSGSSTATSSSNGERIFTLHEVRTSSDKLLIIENNVYKLSQKWEHPGGEIIIQAGRNHDVTIPFLLNHRLEVVAPLLKRFRAGKMHPDYKLHEMEEDFVTLVKKVQTDPEWFDASPIYYVQKIAWYLSLLALSVCCVLYGPSAYVRVLAGGSLMGFMFQQIAFLGHDLGHSGVTHDRQTDQVLGFVCGNMLSGISVGWWKATHNVHHLVTNSVEYDCDIQHMPVFAVSDKYFRGVYSMYHHRRFELDWMAKKLLSIQHLLYYPIMAVARFNLYLQSFLLLLSPEYKRYGGDSRKLELITLGIFWTWFSLLLSCLPSWPEVLGFLMVSHAIAGLLHVQITASHFPMPVIEGNPLDSGLNFVQFQLQGSVDVDCPAWLDWFHGGLQFQSVHHCFPRVPRHNLRRLRDEIIVPWCQRHEVKYKSMGWLKCQWLVLKTLKETADKLHPFIADGLNAAG